MCSKVACGVVRVNKRKTSLSCRRPNLLVGMNHSRKKSSHDYIKSDIGWNIGGKCGGPPELAGYGPWRIFSKRKTVQYFPR